MDDQAMKARIESIFATGDMSAMAEAQDEMAAEDVVVEWPQSGERIRGRANAAAINANYPSSSGMAPKATLRRVVAPGDVWIIEATIDYGNGVPVSMVSILELEDGKIARQTEYFAEPFEAPAWRTPWVERIDEPAPVG